MPSRRKGDLSAVAKAEILSPEMHLVARGQALHLVETSNGMRANNGECIYGVPGSKVAAGKSTVVSELGRSGRLSETENRVGSQKATKRDGLPEVGSVHSSTVRETGDEGTDTRTMREGRTVPDSAAGDTWVKLTLITGHARQNPTFRFTCMYHLLNKGFLRANFLLLDKHKAVGIDGITWEEYAGNLEENLTRLESELMRRVYKPKPSRRVYIPKNEHEKRPLGISAIESKIVESSVKQLLESIYEVDFLPCSYGFRPERGCHDALEALYQTITYKPVNYVVEADIKGFFDNVPHERLMDFLKIRIGDTSLLELIGKFLKAGYVDKGKWNETEQGTPQGSIMSPMLSNIFLHYTLDKWFEETVRRHIRGYARLIRYADDFVVAVQYQEDAYKIEKAIKNRFAKYGLQIHPTKSRCISFGRFERTNAERSGRKANTFDFLGFTHYCDKTRKGKFKVGRKTQKKKFVKACKAIHTWLKAIRNMVEAKEWWPILAAKMRGHYNYYGIRGNCRGIWRFYTVTKQKVFYWLNRRSQKRSMFYAEYEQYLKSFPLPKPEIIHDQHAMAM